ncbi:2-oxoglutarate oxidoreductase subunit KorB [subsurface metagenome]
MISSAYNHKGTSFLEIYQNCLIFNNGAFSKLTEKATKFDYQLVLEHGKPMLFGENRQKGIWLDGHKPVVVEIGDSYSVDDIAVHDKSDRIMALILSEFTYRTALPTPIGILYETEHESYEKQVHQQMQAAVEKLGPGDINALLRSGHTWEVK